MKKLISLVSLFAGIAVFAACINVATSSIKVEKRSEVIELAPVVVASDVQVPVSNVYGNVSIAKKPVSKPIRSHVKRSNFTLRYNHSLEQGATPDNSTVRVVEYL